MIRFSRLSIYSHFYNILHIWNNTLALPHIVKPFLLFCFYFLNATVTYIHYPYSLCPLPLVSKGIHSGIAFFLYVFQYFNLHSVKYLIKERHI